MNSPYVWQSAYKPSWVLVKKITEGDGNLWQYNIMQVKITKRKYNVDTHLQLRLCDGM